MAETVRRQGLHTGHWEIGGVVVPTPFPTYPDGFPAELVAEFEKRAGVRTYRQLHSLGDRDYRKARPRTILKAAR